MDKYKIIKNLGDGTYGSVAQATNKQNNETVAIKKMKKKFYSWDECMQLREIKALRKLNHPNIVKLKEVIRVNNDLYLVFEYMQGNVYEMIKDNRTRGLSEEQIKSVLYQTLEGLDYMHQHGVFHRDLKPENLLFYNGQVKVADFGLSKDIRSQPPHTDYVSTRWYRAPEILLHSTTYNAPVDIFAMGCIAAELFTGQPLFPGRSEQDQMYRICAVLGKPPASWQEGYSMAVHIGTVFPKFQPCDLSKIISKAPPQAIDLIQKMLLWDPQYRPTARDCLNHPYFADQRRLNANVERQVESQVLTNYVGGPTPQNQDSENLLRRNKTLIASAVQQQLFGDRREDNGHKPDLYYQKYGTMYSNFHQQSQQPFQQQSQTQYPKYMNTHSVLPLGQQRQNGGLRNESQPVPYQKNSNYFDEAVQLNQNGNGRNKHSNIFGTNFDQMLKKNDQNYKPVPTLDQRFQREPQPIDYKNYMPHGLNSMSVTNQFNGLVNMNQGGLGRFNQ